MIQEYNNALYTIINAFVEKYYTYSDGSVADFDIIGINSNMHPWPVEIADYYRSISDIYTALLNDIPSDTLFERYDYSLNQYELKEPIINLYSYWRWARVYTQEERDKDNTRIKEKYNELVKEITKKKKMD
jgi:hypothetical protein